MSYLLAWGVAVAAGVIGTVGLFMLTRSVRSRWLRNLLRWLPVVLLLVPAPVPGYSGEYAPAFIVLLFEGLFQTEGQPQGALTILVVTLVLAGGLILLLSRGRREARSDLEKAPN